MAPEPRELNYFSDMSIAPGWYPDPVTPGHIRRWDGSGWTDEVREHVVEPELPVPAAVEQLAVLPEPPLPDPPPLPAPPLPDPPAPAAPSFAAPSFAAPSFSPGAPASAPAPSFAAPGAAPGAGLPDPPAFAGSTGYSSPGAAQPPPVAPAASTPWGRPATVAAGMGAPTMVSNSVPMQRFEIDAPMSSSASGGTSAKAALAAALLGMQAGPALLAGITSIWVGSQISGFESSSSYSSLAGQSVGLGLFELAVGLLVLFAAAGTAMGLRPARIVAVIVEVLAIVLMIYIATKSGSPGFAVLLSIPPLVCLGLILTDN